MRVSGQPPAFAFGDPRFGDRVRQQAFRENHPVAIDDLIEKGDEMVESPVEVLSWRPLAPYRCRAFQLRSLINPRDASGDPSI